jgi:hypothetical protein
MTRHRLLHIGPLQQVEALFSAGTVSAAYRQLLVPAIFQTALQVHTDFGECRLPTPSGDLVSKMLWAAFKRPSHGTGQRPASLSGKGDPEDRWMNSWLTNREEESGRSP